MDRDVLRELSRDELIDMVIRLREMLGMVERLQATIVGLERQVAEQAARVAELEAELARCGGPPKTPENSSLPPSQAIKPDRAERRGKKRGPKRGHLGMSRRRQAPDVVVRCRPTACRGCGAVLGPKDRRRVRRSQVVELPELRPLVLEVWAYAARCAACGERTVAEAPPGFEPGRTFGPRIEALLGYLHYGHHLSHERLATVCGSVFGLAISEGAIAAALARLAERAQPEAEAIGERVRASPVINSDETSVRVDGKNRWHWVFQTPAASYHVIAPSRGADVVAAFLGDARPAVWGSDAYPSQLAAPAAEHQLCLSHQIRDLTYAEEADEPFGQRWARELRHVFGRAIRLHRLRAGLTAEQFATRRTRVERAAERLISGPPLGRGEAWKLQRRYRQHHASLFVFLHREDVEPTNNSSERDLRNSVIHDKVTGGYRSARGAEQGAIFATILTTARKLGQNTYERLCALAGPSPLHAARMGT
jgi:transposase